MNTHIYRIALALGLLLSLQPAFLPARAAHAAPRPGALLPAWFATETGPEIEPALLHQLAASEAASAHGAQGVTLRIIVRLRPAAPTTVPLADKPDAARADTPARAALVTRWQRDFAQSKRALAPMLAQARRAGELVAQTDLWIINGLAITARPALIRRLMASPDVAAIRLDAYRQYLAPENSAGLPDAQCRDPRCPPASAATGAQPQSPGNATRSVGAPQITWGLKHIRVSEVWNTLGISGTGAVVGIMDSGVDLLHPALNPNYRGNLGNGLYRHESSWFDPISGGPYPYDDNAHGTHIAGTAVGRAVDLGSDGELELGVAPGARWIAVKILDYRGGGYEAWIHAGFQWLLAPNGDPAMAPDVVNASWASPQSDDTTFAQDAQRLHDAGIAVIFAAGNFGPAPASMGSPASNPHIFSVGANDQDDEVARFSSRGPSPWGEVKPGVVAPGVLIASSVPGGGTALANGTSSAAPHVAGIAAMMRAVSPTLPIAALTRIITETAVPLTTTLPNNDSGWGRVDAFAALSNLTRAALVSGLVRRIGGPRLAESSVTAVPHGPEGHRAQAVTGSDGTYTLALRDGVYDVTATAFGHEPQTQWRIEAQAGTEQTLNFVLTPLPGGEVRGRVTVSGTQAPPTSTVIVRALDTPATTTLAASGAYSLALPAGFYTLEARALGYRVARAGITVTEDAIAYRDIVLTPAPRLLLVDEGAWYYGSQTGYWKEALDALDLDYDVTRIKDPQTQAPGNDALAPYDVVLWSSPQGSPGVVSGGTALKAYLDAGGKLLLSGQNVAYYDGGGDYLLGTQAYFRQNLGALFMRNRAELTPLSGAGPFEGISVTIQGGDGANNQTGPEEVAIRDLTRSAALWHYEDGAVGGVGASICVPYRAILLAFGFEAIAGEGERQAVMARSLDWLTAPPPTTGLTLELLGTPVRVGQPGERITHTAQLRHIGMGGEADAITVRAEGQRWPTSLTPASATLDPCETLTVTLLVTIPQNAQTNWQDTVDLVVRATNTPPGNAPALTVTVQTKTPAPILLVDDDRWTPVEALYEEALRATGLPFDHWDTDGDLGGTHEGRSPTTATLALYPIVVWFTGYDWFRPILPQEAAALEAYLAGGGRLLLSSQDFLYYHSENALSEQLGVLAWRESDQTTVASGVPDHPAGGSWGPVALAYPFQNWADALEPAPLAQPVVRGQAGQPIAIANATESPAPARTLFYAFPLETLPGPARARALGDAVGWLSPLGESAWTLTSTVPLPGQRVTHTLALRNDGAEAQAVAFTHTVPTSLTLVAESVPAALIHVSATRTLAWSGTLPARDAITFTWASSVQAPAGTAMTSTVTLGLPAWGVTFTRQSPLRVAGADLGSSRWLLPEENALHFARVNTLTLRVHNRGSGALAGGSVHLWLMKGTTPITASGPAPWGWSRHWPSIDLAPGESRVFTVPLRAWWSRHPLRVDAILEDDTGQRWELRRWFMLEARQVYLPVVMR